MFSRSVLAFGLVGLLLISNLSRSASSDVDDDDEDLALLREAESSTPGSESNDEPLDSGPDDQGYEADGLEENSADLDSDLPVINEKDVVVLHKSNFSDFVQSNRFVMVEFYAPWCGHCQSLAPEYAAAASQLKEEGIDVILAKIDGSEDTELSEEYKIEGFPTIFYYSDGVNKTFNGARSKETIVNWIKKRMGPGISNLTTLDEAKKVLSSETKLVVGYLNSLVGPESQELVAAARLDDELNFYQTDDSDVAKLFHFGPDTKRPALILIKDEDEKLSYFDGKFSKSEIADFVLSNKLPLVSIFTMENAGSIFDSEIKKQVILFETSTATKKYFHAFQEAAKFFKGKIIFVYVQSDHKEFGKTITEYFGITGTDSKVIAYTGNEEAKKFFYDGKLTKDTIKEFATGFLEDKLKPFYKSDLIPEPNDGDVKIVVGHNFDDIVLDESKDVLLEIYAPWCGHCQSLEPTYNKLAKHLRGIDSLVIAKMDGTSNEHPRAKQDGYPTLLFFPAGKKSFEPITLEGDRTVVSMYKFIKKHASIPFKLQKKPASDDSRSSSVIADEAKDEL